MISLFQVSKSRNEHDVLSKVSLSLTVGEHVGLVGGNGAGKTTLIEILLGKMVPDEGSIQSTETIGALPQAFDFQGETIGSLLCSRVEEDGSWLEYCLKRVGLGGLDCDQRADDLSGGQKTRLGLALALFERPTALVLDEPTNHLDRSGLEWLTAFLNGFPGIVLVVSHDRAFLDAVADRIVLLEGGELKAYGGGYSEYETQRQQERETAERLHEESVAEKQRLERLRHDLLRKANETSFKRHESRDNDKFALNMHVGNAMRQLEKKAQATRSRIEKRETAPRPFTKRTHEKSFEGSIHAGKLIVGTTGLRKSFGRKAVFDGFDFEVRGPERIWLSGENGSGKSTLLALLNGDLLPDEGRVNRGEGIRVGYFRQGQALPSEAGRLIDLLQDVCTDQEKIYRVARSLGFSPELLQRSAQELSRGQRTKLTFVKLFLAENQLLLLDEPTNHLEISTREEIEGALQAYEGALVIASHDRAFVERVGIDREVCLGM